MKNKKKEDLHIRITPRDKEKIQKNASNHNMSLTEYITEAGLHGSVKEKDVINGAEACVAYREFMEYCIKKFGCDEEIIKKGDKIWDTIVRK